MSPAHHMVTCLSYINDSLRIQGEEKLNTTIPKIPTCCLNSILSLGDFLNKLDIKDRGNTKAALPIRTKASNIELTPMDVPGLKIRMKLKLQK